MKIYLSPSDQHSNITASGHSEADHCLQIAQACEKYLKLNGFSVKIGNNTKEKTYSARVTESNQFGANLHVCIHTNAGGGKGTLVMCYPNFRENKYVTNIYNEVSSLTPTVDKGISETKNLYEINNTNCICVYVECEFHDNKETENWIDANIDNLGKSIAKGICKADSKIFVDSVNDYQPTSGLYKVQVGAFKEKTNADKLAEELKRKGYSVYIVRG